jgi:tRNA modification GTPase
MKVNRTNTAARVTPAGRGAVAVIRVCGGEVQLDAAATALFQPVNRRPWSQQRLSRPIYGRWGRDDLEDVVVCRLSASEFEVQCHSGELAVQKILRDLTTCGIATVTADDQAAASLDICDWELQTALMRAATARTAELLAEQADGLLTATYRQLADLSWKDAARRSALEIIDALLHWSNFGIHLSRPWSVVLTGRPNVGKSSLINALLGYRRAIVADQPGTTRDVVSSLTALDGWPVALTDTAGLRTNTASLEAAGIALAREQLRQADLRVLLIDIGEPPCVDDDLLRAEWPDALVVAHKVDRSNRWGDRVPAGAIGVSSLSGVGLDSLISAIVRRLVRQEPPRGTPLPITDRQVRSLREIASVLQNADEPQFRDATRALLQGEPGA